MTPANANGLLSVKSAFPVKETLDRLAQLPLEALAGQASLAMRGLLASVTSGAAVP